MLRSYYWTISTDLEVKLLLSCEGDQRSRCLDLPLQGGPSAWTQRAPAAHCRRQDSLQGFPEWPFLSDPALQLQLLLLLQRPLCALLLAGHLHAEPRLRWPRGTAGSWLSPPPRAECTPCKQDHPHEFWVGTQSTTLMQSMRLNGSMSLQC